MLPRGDSRRFDLEGQNVYPVLFASINHLVVRSSLSLQLFVLVLFTVSNKHYPKKKKKRLNNKLEVEKKVKSAVRLLFDKDLSTASRFVVRSLFPLPEEHHPPK